MDAVQGTKPDIRTSGKPAGAEVRGIDLSRDLDDAVYTHKGRPATSSCGTTRPSTWRSATTHCQRRLMHRTAICGVEEFGAKVLAD